MVCGQPQLSPEDGRQLAALFAHGRCPFALARQTAQPLHEIIHWLALPHIREALAAITRLESNAHRAAAIEALRRTMEKTEDLVEKRRAACAILRALNPAPPRLRSVGDPGGHRPAAHTHPPQAPPGTSPAGPPSAHADDPASVGRVSPCASHPRSAAAPTRTPAPGRTAAISRSFTPPTRTPAALLARAGARGTPDLTSLLNTTDLLTPIILTPDSS